ncbi:MAG: hypothetical protein JO359_13500 [Candidatus Eremiobacteraeota bacterium]|nr:hypothetical protein [Candidatus Eremiobacteraeota bacterium]
MFAAAQRALRVEDLEAYNSDVRKAVGPPWNNDHRLAMAAAVIAATTLAATPER